VKGQTSRCEALQSAHASSLHLSLSQWVSLRHHADTPCCASMYKGETFFREVEESPCRTRTGRPSGGDIELVCSHPHCSCFPLSDCFRAEPRLRDMDEQHVNVQVLSTVPVMFSYQAKPEDALDLHRSGKDGG
jgi:hypothetical protein